MIKQENGKFVVYSESGRKFGTYDTQEKAKRRLSQMEMFKHMKKTAQQSVTKYKFGTKMVERNGVLRKEWGAVPYTEKPAPVDSVSIKTHQEQINKKPQPIGITKKGSVPKLKNFFAAEPTCVVHGSGKQCVTGKAPSFSKKAEHTFEKFATSPLKLRKVLSKHINSLKTVGLEDFQRVNGSIDRMMGDIFKKNIASRKPISKIDKVNLHVLKHESNRLGSRYANSLVQRAKKNKNDLKPGIN